MHLESLTSGKNVPQEVNVIVEIPQGSAVKYEVDKESGYVMVDRFLHTSMNFPFNYGFIPHTMADDGDPVDVVVITSLPVVPGVLMSARPIGMLEMEDEAGLDNKIIAVPMEKVDPHFANVQEITDIHHHTKERIKHFFETYKALEPGKWVKTKEFLGKEAAYAEIKKSLK